MRAVAGFAQQDAKSIKEAAAATSNSKRVMRLPGAPHAANLKSGITAREDKRKRAEESLRTVMYLSCWGPT
ncbi:hypothetical protein COCNU_scaffold014963G000010 [Cocos nucifera]|nr:hypothetical protein [Cocos nucifera]